MTTLQQNKSSQGFAKSIVWEYFIICKNDARKVECLVCKSNGGHTLLSRGGKHKSTTTNMRSHLRSLHPSKYNELTANEKI